MLARIKQINKYSIDKTYLILVCLSTLLPGFGAIDNNPVRWMSLGFISVLFIIYDSFLNKNQSKIYFKNSWIIIFSSVFVSVNTLISDNLNESLISLYKLVVIVSVFYSCYIATKRIRNPLLFICYLFTFSLFFESIYTIFDFLNFFNNSFTGISQNRNISSSSLVFKLIFLIYLIDNSTLISRKINLKIIEVLALISIICLQSRLGLYSTVGIYILYLILMKSSRKNIIISLIAGLLFFQYFNTTSFENKIQKNYTFQNISFDTSSLQRLGFYKTSLSLFKQKPFFGHGLGSWKYKSLQYGNQQNQDILVPYYTHNDFLQILMEAGLIGFLIYASFFWLLFLNILKFRGDKSFVLMLIVLVVILTNSFINFPIHRPQEYIPFIVVSSFIFSNKNIYEKNNQSNRSSFLLILLIPSLVLAKNEYSSLKVQGVLINDYKKNEFSLDLKEIEKIKYKLPNLSSNVVPISTYLSRYYFNKNRFLESTKLLAYSLKVNRNDLLTKELLLKNYIFTNQKERAYELAKDLVSDFPENKDYKLILQAISNDINKKQSQRMND